MSFLFNGESVFSSPVAIISCELAINAEEASNKSSIMLHSVGFIYHTSFFENSGAWRVGAQLSQIFRYKIYALVIDNCYVNAQRRAYACFARTSNTSGKSNPNALAFSKVGTPFA